MRSRDPHRVARDPGRHGDEAGRFERWHARTKNLYGTYRTQDAAPEGDWTAPREQGEPYAGAMILAVEDARGETQRIAAVGHRSESRPEAP